MTDPTPNKVETKTKASTTAAGVGSFVLLVLFGLTSPDEILAHVPDGLTSTAAAALLAAVTFFSGYAKAHVPGKLSQSAQDALERLRGRRAS
jgi:hypothetical protein